MRLVEDSRQKLIQQAKQGDKYKGKPKENRYTRRNKSKIANSTKEFNSIDMNKFFKEDILDVDIRVYGETDQYLTSVSFSGILEKLQEQLESGQPYDYRVVMRALIDAFNRGDVYVKCSCPDWRYRINYWSSVNDISLDPKETRPSDITNPDDTKGPACKHVCLVLSNTSWMSKIARVITNYSKYVESHYPNKYKQVIFPAVYGKPYTDALDDTELYSSSTEIDIANAERAVSGRFKKGNTFGVRFAKNDDTDVEDDSESQE